MIMPRHGTKIESSKSNKTFCYKLWAHSQVGAICFFFFPIPNIIARTVFKIDTPGSHTKWLAFHFLFYWIVFYFIK
jgi:hypothetical protein